MTALTQTADYSLVEHEGRDPLSRRRKVQLPVENFDDHKESGVEFVPFTPISQALRATHNQSTDTLGPPKVVKFRIYLSRVENPANAENGIELNIESGKTADSETLLFHLAKEYDIEYEAFCEMFAIWMVSPLLEIQLKPEHRPYECRQGWETLLNRFTDVPRGRTLVVDEPILILRRSAVLTSDREFQLLNRFPQCAHFLIIDAREMILLGRLHFLSLDETIRVAALLFCLQYGDFKEQEHDVAFIRNNIEEMLPERTCESIAAKTIFGKSMNKKTAQEEQLLNYWRECSKQQSETEKEYELLKTLAEHSSCYGAAWFAARMEKKTSRASLRNFGQTFAEVEVNVGINDRFLTIIDANFTEPLLVQSLDEMSWKLEGNKEDQTQFLILNISCDEEIKEGFSTQINITNNETTLFLMITGNQTPLIDALLNRMSGRRLERTISDSSSSSDSSTSSAGHAALIQSKLNLKNCSASSNRKLCSAKFKDGKCTEVAGSFKAFYCQGQML